MQKSKKAFTAINLMRQLILSSFALDLHQTPCQDLKKLWKQIFNKYSPQLAVPDDDYFYLSFEHLYGYGPCYYGYLWSKVFALDILEKGLLNPIVGRQYIEKIIGKGGSVDPNYLLKDFLMREPDQEAFFKSIGIAK